MSIPPTSDDIQDARERARLAMGGGSRIDKQTTEDKTNQEKRLIARQAMEGLERRQRRENREKEAIDKETMRKRIDEEVKRRVAETAQKKLDEENKRKSQQLAREQEIKQKENEFTQSQNVIEELKKEKGSSLHPLRTLQSDLAGAVQEEQLSATKIAISEQERGSTAYPIKKNPSGALGKIIIFFIILLLLISGGAGGYWYWINRTQTKNTTPNVVQSIIYAETSTEVDTNKIPEGELTSTILKLINTPATTGETISNVYFTKTATSSDGVTKTKALLNFSEWLKYSHSSIPEDFSRFINAYMVGLYKSPEQNSIFITFKIDLFDNVFQELLDHENDYIQDVFKNLGGNDIVGTSTKRTFSDRRIKNIDTRILTDDQGKILIIYSFLDKQTLIIAQNENALYRAYVAYNTPKPTN